MGQTFKSVSLEAEQVTETHRTLENDHTVTAVELPGVVNLYLVVDGGRVLLDQFKAPVILEAIERGKQAKEKADAEQAANTPQAAPEPAPTTQTQADTGTQTQEQPYSGPQSQTTQQADTGSQPQG